MRWASLGLLGAGLFAAFAGAAPADPYGLAAPVARILRGIDPVLKEPDAAPAARAGLLAERERVLVQIELAAHERPAEPEAQLQVGRALMTVGEPARARPFLDAAAGLARSAGDSRMQAAAMTAGASAREKTGDYAGAAVLAKQALAADPNDREALALYMSTKGRDAASAAPAPAPEVAPRFARSSGPGVASAASAPTPAAASRRSRAPAVVPPAPGALDPKNPRFWDQQLLGPMLKESDANVVAREYLSPMIRADKVTIRVVRPVDKEFKKDWGDYDSQTSVIRYNLDKINDEIGEYDAYYAKQPAKRVAPISGTRPLNAAQIEFLAHRFLPLAVHEAGGHGTHGEDLRKLLGRNSMPNDIDTEVLSWRMEAAAIADERRRDPNYLKESTPWANLENEWMRVWNKSREKGGTALIDSYLDSMGYRKMFNAIKSDSAVIHHEIARSIELLQSHCRQIFDAACQKAADLLTPNIDRDQNPSFKNAEIAFRKNPSDASARAAFVNELYAATIVDNQLDSKGLKIATTYYKNQAARVSSLENKAVPIGIMGNIMAFLNL